MMISNKKKILVIGAGWEQFALIETIKNEGHYIVATHPSIDAEGFRIADQYYVKDSRDIKSHIQIAETHNIDAIVSDNCDYSLFTGSVVASKLNIPFNSIQSALYSNDKFAQRECVLKSGLKQPRFVKVQTITELFNSIEYIQFPAVLKPVDSRGTFGVTIINSIDELKLAYYDAIDNSPSRTLIFEQFINGILVTVDGFCFNNGHKSLTVASRKFEKGAKPVTKEIIYPAQFSDDIKNKLLQNHHNIVTSLGYNYGHTHGEYILTEENEIYLVECANRGGGVYTSTVIVPLLTQINLNKILINQALGIDNYIVEYDKLSDFMSCSVILTFLDYEVGKVIDTINIQEMRDKSYTVRFRSKFNENDMVESVENCASRHSMLVIKGDNSENAINNLALFKNDLNIVYH